MPAAVQLYTELISGKLSFVLEPENEKYRRTASGERKWWSSFVGEGRGRDWDRIQAGEEAFLGHGGEVGVGLNCLNSLYSFFWITPERKKKCF